jgi:hypothetical protein
VRRRAVVLTRVDKARRGLVCLDCAKLGVLVVAAVPGNVVPLPRRPRSTFIDNSLPVYERPPEDE